MDQELFNPQSSSVSSSRIIYTPSTFARTSLLHLQEVGSLQAVHPHVSQREDLVSSSVTMEVQKHEKKIWDRKNDASGARPLVINCKFKMNKILNFS